MNNFPFCGRKHLNFVRYRSAEAPIEASRMVLAKRIALPTQAVTEFFKKHSHRIAHRIAIMIQAFAKNRYSCSVQKPKSSRDMFSCRAQLISLAWSS